jgi:hypothetical protein
MGYAVGGWTKMGRPERFSVRAACVYLEDKSVTNYTLDVVDLRHWIREIDQLPTRYAVNRRCVYCTLNDSCKVFQAYLAGSIRTVRQFTDSIGRGDCPHGIRGLAPDDRAKLMMGLKMADTAVKRCRENIKEEAIAHGDIDVGNGNRYTIRTRTTKVPLTSRVLSVISKYVTAEAVTKATTLSLPSLITSAMDRVKGPMKSVVKKEVEAALDKARAVVYHEAAYLETVNSEGNKTCQRTLKKKSSPPASQKRLRRS